MIGGVDELAVDPLEILLGKARGRAAEAREIERVEQRGAVVQRLDRVRVPSRASSATIACGKMCFARSSFTPSEPSRLDSLPSAPVSSASCAKRGGVLPRAVNICSCTAVFDTWSSPRRTCVTFISTSSIADAACRASCHRRGG